MVNSDVMQSPVWLWRHPFSSSSSGLGTKLGLTLPFLPYKTKSDLALNHWIHHWFLSLSFFLCAHNLRSTSSKLQKLERKSCFLLYSWVTFSRSRASSLQHRRLEHELSEYTVMDYNFTTTLSPLSLTRSTVFENPVYVVHTSAARQKIALCHA